MEPHCVIIFGATGDLAEKKLLPALKTLYVDNGLAMPIICCGRKEFTHKQYLDEAEQSDSPKEFTDNIYYFQLDFEKPRKEEFMELANELNQKYRCERRFIFYFSLPTSVFASAIDFINETKINEHEGRIKLAFEKPFGTDLGSAKELQKKIKTIFSDDQIFLVDHYLGKDFIQNLLILRFTNRILDQVWSSENIDHIQITLSEKEGIDGRGKFYEKMGAIRDVVQNHMLQLASLIGMECPEKLDSEEIEEKKAKFLGKIEPVEQKNIVVGQYQGYREEENVDPDSETETFAAILFYVDEPHWKDVPWYVRTGKQLNEDRVDVKIILKKTDKMRENQHEPTINLELKPEYKISISFNTKKPGEKAKLMLKELDFCFSCEGGVNTSDAYELIFEDIIKNDHTIFVSWEVIFASWKFTDDMIEKAQNSKLRIYPKGSEGPEEAASLIQKGDRQWILKQHRDK